MTDFRVVFYEYICLLFARSDSVVVCAEAFMCGWRRVVGGVYVFQGAP